MKSYTLGAFGRDDIIDVLGNRGTALPIEVPGDAARVDCGIWTFGFACPAVDAIARNDCRHLKFPTSERFEANQRFVVGGSFTTHGRIASQSH
jgi:hypothetical protein